MMGIFPREAPQLLYHTKWKKRVFTRQFYPAIKMDYREKGTDHMMGIPRILTNTKRSDIVGGRNCV